MEHPLRAFRRRAKLTLDDLAEVSGESKSKLSRIENRHQDADLDFIRKVVAITQGEVTATDFLRTPPVREAAE